IVIKNTGEIDRIWSIDMILEDESKIKVDGKKPDSYVKVGELAAQDQWSQEYDFEVKDSLLKIEQKYDEQQGDETIAPMLTQGVETKVKYTLTVTNKSQWVLSDIEIVKKIPDLASIKRLHHSIGDASSERSYLRWTVESLEPKATVEIAVDLEISMGEETSYSAGEVIVNCKISEETYSKVNISFLDGISDNFQFLERIEQEENPDNWECHFELENISEFDFYMKKCEIWLGEAEEGEVVNTWDYQNASMEERIVNPAEVFPVTFELESDETPEFGHTCDFTVGYTVLRQVDTKIKVPGFELSYIRVQTEKTYNTLMVPSYRPSEVFTTLKIESVGNSPLTTVLIEDFVPEDFKPPEAEEITVMRMGGDVVKLDEENYQISIEAVGDLHSIKAVIEDLDQTEQGKLETGQWIELIFPIYAISPKPDKEYFGLVEVKANQKPPTARWAISSLGEGEVPVITVMHSRRRIRIGKSVSARATAKNLKRYEVKIKGINKGTGIASNVQILDKIPAGFELVGSTKEFPSVRAETVKESSEGTILKWVFEEIDPEGEFSITYEIEGSGDADPRDIQAMITG
ncbi:MAG: hypothetical protein KAR35_06825, partial [Candidatus Heimdallarchaeota archaeon]|nr:hypothetical protein [Candidatus Heimdallarchaeota archaeon]MCK5049072.1 hypothetical protein [Candidatus Heimdallarchaeota archaeon]